MAIKRPADSETQVLAAAAFVYLVKSNSEDLAYYAARVFRNIGEGKGCKRKLKGWGEGIASAVAKHPAKLHKSERWTLVMASAKEMKDAPALEKLGKSHVSKLEIAITAASAAMTDDDSRAKLGTQLLDVGRAGTSGDMALLHTVDGYNFFGFAPCAPRLPTSTEAGRLTAIIFAEAAQERQSNDERLAIAWTVLNRIRHVATHAGDKKSFGDGTMLGIISTGFLGYDSAQWKKVTSGDLLAKDGASCLTGPECTALTKAVEAATSAHQAFEKNEDPKPDYLKRVISFNQAKNKPPSSRQRKLSISWAGKDPPHTFYEFIPGREEN